MTLEFTIFIDKGAIILAYGLGLIESNGDSHNTLSPIITMFTVRINSLYEL